MERTLSVKKLLSGDGAGALRSHRTPDSPSQDLPLSVCNLLVLVCLCVCLLRVHIHAYLPTKFGVSSTSRSGDSRSGGGRICATPSRARNYQTRPSPGSMLK